MTKMAVPLHAVQAALSSQYRASLSMLREAIEVCPDDLWLDRRPTNAFWQIAYHTLYFGHLYLQTDSESFQPWVHHQKDVQHPDGIPGRADPGSDLPLIPGPYTRKEVLEYCDFCSSIVDEALGQMDLASDQSGFSWYPISKLEHQFVNLRHIQHGAAQLADRIRAARAVGVRWVGTAQPRSA